MENFSVWGFKMILNFAIVVAKLEKCFLYNNQNSIDKREK